MKTKPTIGITMGDPAGIGPEICLKALSTKGIIKVCLPIVIGDPEVMRRNASLLSIPIQIMEGDSPPLSFHEGELFVIPATEVDLKKVVPGRIDGITGRASFDFLVKAVSLVMDGKINGVVTGPVSKMALQLAGLPYSGHTEIFSHLTGTRDSVMMFVVKKLRVALVSRHLPLKEAIHKLDPSIIERVIEISHEHLFRWFFIKRPRIGVAGINPHAGEGGLFGKEEEIITEAIERARRKGIDVRGPISADSIFYLACKGEYDLVVAMYHDQGLIPVKLIDFHGAVNITLGLPFVRTSVSHGTACDIAGKGIADPSSLVKAIRLATKLSSLHRKR